MPTMQDRPLQVAMFDPSLAGLNLGDEIIAEAVMEEIRELLGPCHIIRLSLHQGLRGMHRKLLKKVDRIVLGGSNMMNLRMWPIRGENRWKIPFEEARWLRDVTLFGVGWSGYNHEPNWFGVKFYETVLAKNALHSVRDEHTRQTLESHGLQGIVTTACPTMWRFDDAHCAKIPVARSRDVVTTITNYNQDLEKDRKMLRLLKQLYDTVYLWPQGAPDWRYLVELDIDGLEILEPSLQGYDRLLSRPEPLDYVGTRLHAGIRAIQHQRRSIILGIDNRATEMNRTTGLPVVQRADLGALEDKLTGEFETKIHLPTDAIERFRNDFKKQGA